MWLIFTPFYSFEYFSVFEQNFRFSVIISKTNLRKTYGYERRTYESVDEKSLS